MGLLLGSGSTRPQYPYDMWYGIQGDFTSRDYELERVGNMDLHRTLPIQKKLRRFVENPDGSVKYYLHQNDSRKKDSGAPAIIDGTDGNVMLEKPEYYFRYEVEGTKWIRAYSEYPLPGFIKMERKTVSPWYATIKIDTNEAVSGCFLEWNGDEIARDENGYVKVTANAADYRGGAGAGDASKDGTYNSMLGMPRTSISKANARAACKNGTHLGVYRVYNEIAWLQRLEYASLHCQDAYSIKLTEYAQGGLGTGPSVNGNEWNEWGGYKPFIPCGVTATLGNNTGQVSYVIKGWTGGDKTVTVSSYRGLENPFCFLYSLADDVLIWHKEDVSIAYVCENPDKFASPSDNADTAPDGYEAIAELPREDGYILQLSHSSKGYSFPESTGGSSNAGACDYFHTYADNEEFSPGWCGALLAGYANYGSSAGFGYLYTYVRSSYSNAYSGFRLCRF